MLSDRIDSRKIITVEVLLPLSGNIKPIVEAILPLREYVDALNIPSNPLGKLRPDALIFAYLLQRETKIETIPHFVARHFTSLSFESHLLGAAALGIQNILCVTGDTPLGGRSAFELNSWKLLAIARQLGDGLTSSRKAIQPVPFCRCTSFNPNVPNINGEFVKTASKYHAGAEVFFTQPVFRVRPFLEVMKEFRRRYPKTKVIAGLSYLHTKKRGFALMKFLGIPYKYIESIEECDETERLFETARLLKDHVDGFYIIPIARYQLAYTLVRRIRTIL